MAQPTTQGKNLFATPSGGSTSLFGSSQTTIQATTTAPAESSFSTKLFDSATKFQSSAFGGFGNTSFSSVPTSNAATITSVFRLTLTP